MPTLTVRLKRPHALQALFIDSTAKRKVIRAGRRGGKTTGMSILAVQSFLAGRRVLYATPTADQVGKFWYEVKAALEAPIQAGVFYKNESSHIIELPGTEQRIRAKTAWNADSLRGDYADVLILDEYQLMNEDAWLLVGAPMLLDNNGDAVFVYTPPSMRSRSVTKANDPRHASKLFTRASEDDTGRWATFHFTSFDNPTLSTDALEEIALDMTALGYRQEILAEDIDHVPGALWTRQLIEACMVRNRPDMKRVVVSVDPAITSGEDSNETGIIVAGLGGDGLGYTLDDRSLHGTPDQWARVATDLYHSFEADVILVEDNQGGEMVEYTIKTVDKRVNVKRIRAKRGKYLRAEPVAALYEQGKWKHYGSFPELEDQQCTWVPGEDSPDRLDALVQAATDLLLKAPPRVHMAANPFFD